MSPMLVASNFQARFSTNTVLSNHMQKTHCPADLPYRCGCCDFSTSALRYAVDHFYINHADSGILQCPFCLQVNRCNFLAVSISMLILFFILRFMGPLIILVKFFRIISSIISSTWNSTWTKLNARNVIVVQYRLLRKVTQIIRHFRNAIWYFINPSDLPFHSIRCSESSSTVCTSIATVSWQKNSDNVQTYGKNCQTEV